MRKGVLTLAHDALGDIAYLATPYTSHPAGLEAAFAEACALAAQVMKDDQAVFSPVARSG